jgi:hypothetical protein
VYRTVLVIWASLAVLLWNCPSRADTLHVPNHYLSIQEAVDASQPGDTIIVASGVYPQHRGNITIEKENITLQSAYGPKKTVIAGKAGSPVISIGEKIQCAVIGFTITLMENAQGEALKGGAVYCGPSSSVAIVHNIITGNRAVFGGGIYCDLYASCRITENIISENTATRYGGGIFSYDAPTIITNNDIINNKASHSGGGFFCRKEAPRVINNVIWANSANTGGGVSCDRSSCTMINNTIVGNVATYGGGVFFDGGSVRIINSIVWDNKDDLFAARFSPASRPDHSNIGDGDFRGLNGNISADPKFVEPENGDFGLRKDSPCIDAGNDDPIYIDVDGSRNDMGAFGGPQGNLRPWYRKSESNETQLGL